ncbi:MAG: response regulator transcription factor [Cyanobacteriota/Melainabacteria group bacterium]
MIFLLADDHAMFRSGLRSILERRFSNAFIQEACSCHEVLALVREESWTIAILDIAMGAENTLSILPEVKQLRPNLPVLIPSMYGEKQFVIEPSCRSGRIYHQGAQAN